MKTFLVLILLFISISGFANNELKCVNFANKETRPYRLEPFQVGMLCNGAATRVSPVLCYREAIRLSRQNLGKHNSAVLCSAAAPIPDEKDKEAFSTIKCYKKALKAMGNSQKLAAVTACSRATDYSVISCAREVKDSRNLKMDWEGAAALCTQGFVAQEKPDNLTHL